MDRTHAKVLVVDDDPSLCKLLSMRLKTAGYAVETAASGEEALGKLARVHPHAVITDLRMGGMDGMSLFESINHRNPALPVIILTAHGTIPDAVDATNRGVFGYFTKPFDSKELLLHLEKAIGVANPQGAEENGKADWCEEIVSCSRIMDDVLEHAWRAAASGTSILIQSESGTGKELLARAIHKASDRHAGAFVAVNCSAIPEQLLESELFGHVKGAFTGASENRRGLFEEADGGTLFLDEIGDMPLTFQGKLLRVLQEREVRPVGANRTIPVDTRIISATHRNLEEYVADGQFREDLFYRLNVIMLELPPLRERREDIPLLANRFLRGLAEGAGVPRKHFSPEALEILVAAPWPGNIRQLSNVVEQTFILSSSRMISAAQVTKALRQEPEELLTFSDARDRFERDYLVKLLQITEGNVTQAARIAGRNRTEFYKLLNKHYLNPGLFRG
jgi:two-component system response regulator GlrR